MKNKFNWRMFALITLVIFGAFQIATWYIKSQKKFNVRHSEAVEQTVTSTGGYVAGSPEIYKVDISPALAWEKARVHNAVWHNLALILIVLTAVFITLMGTNTIELNPRGAGAIVFVTLGLALACWFAAYSSLFSNNFVELNKETYELFKNNLADLFNRPMIR